jgi:hypothetical protein
MTVSTDSHRGSFGKCLQDIRKARDDLVGYRTVIDLAFHRLGAQDFLFLARLRNRLGSGDVIAVDRIHGISNVGAAPPYVHPDEGWDPSFRRLCD